MSKAKNSDNPFAALDASLFPSAPGSKRKGSAPGKVRSSDRQTGAASSPQPSEAEDSLFLSAMGNMTRSKQRAKTNVSYAGENDLFLSAMNKANTPETKTTEDETSASENANTSANNLPNTLADAEKEPDELAFFQAIKGVAPLAGKGREVPPEPEPAPSATPPASHPLQNIVEGKVEFALNCTDEYVEGHVLGLDLMIIGKLQARQYSPESHIDLHGMNSEQAFQALVNFFRSAYYKGVRTTLVVTGRGKNSMGGVSVLRDKVQQWLTQEPFRRVILAFCTAKREDGGPGALYVMLRKQRKNSGKVRWDAIPADPDLFL